MKTDFSGVIFGGECRVIVDGPHGWHTGLVFNGNS